MKQKQRGTHDAAAVLHEILGVNLGHQVAQEIGLHHHELGEQARSRRLKLFSVIAARTVPLPIVTKVQRERGLERTKFSRRLHGDS